MSKRKATVKLTPLWLPYIRDKLGTTFSELQRYSTQRAGGQDAYKALMGDVWNVGDSIRTAPLWWISHDMTTLAADTATQGDFPHADAPSPTGLVFFDGGLPGIHANTTTGDHLPIVGIYWAIRKNRHGDDIICGMQLYKPKTPVLGLPVAPYDAPKTTNELNFYFQEILRAVWALSQEPHVCTTQAPKRATPTDRIPPRIEDDAIRHVKMIVLRENLRSPYAREGDERVYREYDHRFIVRGHWRDQACGPHHSERKRIWVPPYVKGPADKPLIRKDVVRVWRR